MTFVPSRRAVLALSIVLPFAAAGPALSEDCPICAKAIVTNPDLAACFLQKYDTLAAEGAGAIAVDLSRCERSRGIVAPLAGPAKALEEPDTRFLLSRTQLDCLRERLEDPDLVLDPQARIDLGSCG